VCVCVCVCGVVWCVCVCGVCVYGVCVCVCGACVCVVCMCVCSLNYPACKAHALYFHLWSVWCYQIFPHYIRKTPFSEKMLLYQRCVLVCLHILYEIFLILRRSQRDMIKHLYRSSCKVPPILIGF